MEREKLCNSILIIKRGNKKIPANEIRVQSNKNIPQKKEKGQGGQRRKNTNILRFLLSKE